MCVVCVRARVCGYVLRVCCVCVCFVCLRVRACVRACVLFFGEVGNLGTRPNPAPRPSLAVAVASFPAAPPKTTRLVRRTRPAAAAPSPQSACGLALEGRQRRPEQRGPGGRGRRAGRAGRRLASRQAAAAAARRPRASGVRVQAELGAAGRGACGAVRDPLWAAGWSPAAAAAAFGCLAPGEERRRPDVAQTESGRRGRRAAPGEGSESSDSACACALRLRPGRASAVPSSTLFEGGLCPSSSPHRAISSLRCLMRSLHLSPSSVQLAPA